MRAFAAPVTDGSPLLVAHRGASGHRPEHTLPAYRLAVRLGADYIEPDLVATRDGVLVARHENELSATTDVADRPRLAHRRTMKTVGARTVTGWFTEDLTLAELRTLRARERLPRVRPRNTRYDGRYRVPTFDEVLALAAREGRRRGRPVGVYPETKQPAHFASVGLPLEPLLAAALRRARQSGPGAPVLVQSFDPDSLRRVAAELPVRLVQLLGPGAPTTPGTLAEIASYATAVGVHKSLVLPRDDAGRLLGPTPLVRDAHAEGLDVHVWTMRDDPCHLPRACSPVAECTAFLAAGVDGLFGDHPRTLTAARRTWRRRAAGRVAQAPWAGAGQSPWGISTHATR